MAKKCEILGVGVASGNNVSHSNRKTKRRFYPNLKNVSFKSDVLGVNLTLKVAASTLRTINKYGNIDIFLVNFSYLKLSDEARKLRTKIKKKLIKESKLDQVEFPVVKKPVFESKSKKNSKKKKQD